MSPPAMPRAGESMAIDSKPTFRARLANRLLAARCPSPPGPGADISLWARTMVFAPHPDDEVLGCGGTIALKVAAGADVSVVIMTDGRSSHAQFVDAATLIKTRRTEAIEAAVRLGLRPDDVMFLDFEDNRLRQFVGQATPRVAELLERFKPQEVFVPHRRDRLPDHVATFDVVVSALLNYRHSVTLFEYPVWLWNTWPWSAAIPRGRAALTGLPRLFGDAVALAVGCRTRIDISTVLAKKLEALAQYRSQVERPAGNPRWPILADVSRGTFLARFQAGVEFFRSTQHRH